MKIVDFEDFKAALDKAVQDSEKAEKRFERTHFENNNDILSVVLKGHLHIESLLNNILSSLIPDSEILCDSFTFSQKLKIVKSLKLFNSEVIVSINKLRNDFAHDLNQDLSSNKNFRKLVRIRRLNRKSMNDIQRLKEIFYFSFGFLSAIKNVYGTFPFLAQMSLCHDIFKNDPLYALARSATIKETRYVLDAIKAVGKDKIK